MNEKQKKNSDRAACGSLGCAAVCRQRTDSCGCGGGGKTLDVVFTHDTHSHLNSFSTVIDGEPQRWVDLQGSRQ